MFFSSNSELHLDTPFSRLLGKPLIMVAGMTPSAVEADFSSAILDTGYHVELAGGRHYIAAPAALRSKVAEIQKFTPSSLNSSRTTQYSFAPALTIIEICVFFAFVLLLYFPYFALDRFLTPDVQITSPLSERGHALEGAGHALNSVVTTLLQHSRMT
jgi:hypothetical protein